MKSLLLRSCVGLLLGLCLFSPPSVRAQMPSSLDVHMYSGITVTGTVSAAYAIQATTNLTATNNWVVLTNVVLPASPWVYIDYSSPEMVQRFYRAVGMNTNLPPTTTALTKMVLIPPGTFTMGSPLSDPDRNPPDPTFGEGPLTQVAITWVFWMSKYEVTQRDYQAVMGSNPSYFSPNNGYAEDLSRPVEQVTWQDAANYCAKVTVLERAAGRLPAGYVYP